MSSVDDEQRVRQPTPSSSVARSVLLHPTHPSSPAQSFSATPDVIRADTLQISRMLLSPPPLSLSPPLLSISPPTPRALHGPSALSILIAESRANSQSPTRNNDNDNDNDNDDNDKPLPNDAPVQSPPPPSERTPLLPGPALASLPTKHHRFATVLRLPSRNDALGAIPAVILGLLLNILDGVSYGIIVFPATGVFAGFGATGVSMFFVTTIIAQLVYAAGGSGFAGANGSMMIEVVPFFHVLAAAIAVELEGDPRAIIATTMAAFALSSILTGLAFFALGFLNLGVLIGFFPRHILVGCIGGVGIFLLETGFEITIGVPSGSLTYTLATLRTLLSPGALAHWMPALILAILLRLITARVHHQLVFPLYFLTIPLLFYALVFILRVDISTLRETGWLIDVGPAAVSEPWHHFYAYFDFEKTSMRALWVTVPTQLALLFFNILHPPLNVPALAVSLDRDVDTNRELIGHGYSNLLAGFTGSVPNYLVYVNTLLFYRVGGHTRFASLLLAFATALLLLLGTRPIGYIPTTLVGALIFVLGLDLVREAAWDTRGRVSKAEYATVVGIMVVMTVWDFVWGVGVGIVLSCIFFVVQNSRSAAVRAVYTGESALSAVRRPSAHRAYLRAVGAQTCVLRLQGHLFFGTITQVEARIRATPASLRFLVLDLALVAGVDLSAAEAFVRVARVLAARGVVLVLCGFEAGSGVWRALEGVGLAGAGGSGGGAGDESGGVRGVEMFGHVGEALEWTENVYLKAWLEMQKHERGRVIAFPGRETLPPQLTEPLENSPRRSQLRDAGQRIFPPDPTPPSPEPLATLHSAFASYLPPHTPPSFFLPLLPYLTRTTVAPGTTLFTQDEPPDALYVIERGVLRASYAFGLGGKGAGASIEVEESMVAGTLAGELSAVAGMPRNATVVVVGGEAVLWRLGTGELRRMEEELPGVGRAFVRLILKSAKVDYDVLIAALAARR